MATVEFRYDPKSTAWFTANAAMVLKAGEPAYHDTTGLFKLGDGVTALSALSFLPTVSTATPTIQQVLTAGQIATTTIETTGFIKTGGLATEFLKADGSVDSSTYLTTLGTAATSLTTTGSSGAATLIANVLNVPNYTLAGLGGTTLAAVNAQNLSVFAATTSSQLAGVISDETGSGALVFGTSPTFTTNITTPLINGASTASGTLTLASTSNATKGVIQIGTTDLVNIGNRVTTNQRLVRIGQDTGWVDIGSLIGSTSLGAIYINQATPSGSNYTMSSTGSNLLINTTDAISFRVSDSNRYTISSAGQVNTWSPATASSGAITNFILTCSVNTGQTATTNIPNFRILGANKQWATGTVANQYWNYLTANTASFVGASTLSESVALQIDAATAGTNATITNNFALGLLAGTATVKIGNITGSTSLPAIYLNQATPSATNYFFAAVSASAMMLNAPSGGSLNFTIGTANYATLTSGYWNFTPINLGSANITPFTISPGVQTGGNKGAGVNIPMVKITGQTSTWATGTVANQYWNYLTANTASFVGASTITNSYSLFVESAISGTNATITNNYAAGFNGNILITGGSNRIYFTGGTNYFIESDGTLRFKSAFEIFFDVGIFGAVIRTTNTLWQNRDGLNFQYGTTTGSKIGTATTQKISLWNATPDVQPTNAIAAAAFVANTSGIVDDTATWGGYTGGQIVAALKRLGALA